MSATTNNPIFSLRRIVVLAVIVLLSIVLPIGIVIWSVISAMSGKPLGRPSNEFKNYFGVLHGGELWFQVLRFSDKHDPSDYSGEWRIKRLDLETGVERETGLATFNERCWARVMNGEVYVCEPEAVYKRDGSTLVRVSSEPLPGQVFEFNGQLTNAREISDGEFQLSHLVDGHWVVGRKIRVPKRGSVWIDEPHFKLQSPDSSMKAIFAAYPFSVSVVQQAGQDHISVIDGDGFAAYRTGLEFVDDQDEVSALNPENDVQVLSGWEPVQPKRPEDRRWSDLACDRDGVLFATWPGQGRVVRRSADGRWEDLKGLGPLKKYCNRSVIAAPTEARSYVVDSNRYGFSSVFYRIDGNVVHPPHLTIHDCATEYLARWQRLVSGLFVAWLVHLGVLTAGIVWLRRGVSQSSYLFGNQRATLASIPRRGLAAAVDLFLLLATLSLLTYMQSITFGVDLKAILGVELKPFTEDDVCESLIEYEDAARPLRHGMQQGWEMFIINLKGAVRKTSALLFRTTQSHPTCLIVAIVEALCLFGLKIYAEGRVGVTPGKWLLGIRTLRSTLLPCGFARALVRSVLSWIDIPFFVTPGPAAIGLMLSTRRQRIGDCVADTVVVNVGSIREVASC